MKTVKCRFCGGEQPVKRGYCVGCGSEVGRCRDTRKTQQRIECPGCGSNKHRDLEQGRRVCLKCNSVYEAEDVWSLDTRPDIAVEKRERLAVERRRRNNR